MCSRTKNVNMCETFRKCRKFPLRTPPSPKILRKGPRTQFTHCPHSLSFWKTFFSISPVVNKFLRYVLCYGPLLSSGTHMNNPQLTLPLSKPLYIFSWQLRLNRTYCQTPFPYLRVIPKDSSNPTLRNPLRVKLPLARFTITKQTLKKPKSPKNLTNISAHAILL